jgi:membrane-bound serine protease (ClpP class)
MAHVVDNCRVRPGWRWVAATAGALAIAAGAASAPSMAAAPPDGAKDAPKRIGQVIRVELPITGTSVERVRQLARRAVENARDQQGQLVLILEFSIPPDQSEFGRGSEFGAALSIAEFLTSEELSGVWTVAYVPQSIQGHAVLVAMACNEIVMAERASMGLAGVDEKVVTESRRGNYREIADRRKTIPSAVALWMLDPGQTVYVVETELSREFVSAEGLDSLKKTQTIRSQRKLFDADNPARSVVQQRGLLSGEEARRLGLVQYLAGDRQQVAKALRLPPLQEAGAWTAAGARLEGPITAAKVSQIQTIIDDAVRQRNANFICLWINSPGGSLDDSTRLARYLESLKANDIQTVAYIPAKACALSDAALVAVACQQLVMHPDAELGGSGAYDFSEDEIRYTTKAIKAADGPWKHRSWSLVAAMIDPDLQVFRYSRPGEVAYFSPEAWEEYHQEHPDEKDWQQGERVTRPGEPLSLSGTQALEYGLATNLADDFAQFLRSYDLSEDLTFLEPGWADFLIQALASPAVSGFLLMIGFVALYIELHTPGIGIGGFLATVCFVLFFWANFMGATSGWLEVLLFGAGIACLLLEVFVLPGFGIFGLGGGPLVLASLILASQTFILPHNPYQFAQLQKSLLTIAGAGVGFVITAILVRKWLPRAPIVGEVFLEPPQGEEAESIRRREALADFGALLGARGTTTTQLVPAGKARFGNRLVDVVSDGDLIPRGAEIEVVEVHGNRVIVREAGRGQ